jgi:hypothetical protein
MTLGKKLNEAEELYCYEVTTDDGEIRYVVAAEMADAIKKTEEFIGVKSCKFVGLGDIADL